MNEPNGIVLFDDVKDPVERKRFKKIINDIPDDLNLLPEMMLKSYYGIKFDSMLDEAIFSEGSGLI